MPFLVVIPSYNYPGAIGWNHEKRCPFYMFIREGSSNLLNGPEPGVGARSAIKSCPGFLFNRGATG